METLIFDLCDDNSSIFCRPIVIPQRAFDVAFEAFIQKDPLLYIENCQLLKAYKAMHNTHLKEFIRYAKYDGTVLRIIHEMQRKIAKINGEKLYEVQEDGRELREHLKHARSSQSIKSLASQYKTSYTYMGMALLGKKRLKEVLQIGHPVSPASAKEVAWMKEMLTLADQDNLHGNLVTRFNFCTVVLDSSSDEDSSSFADASPIGLSDQQISCHRSSYDTIVSPETSEMDANLPITYLSPSNTQFMMGSPCTLVCQYLKKNGDRGETILQNCLARAGLESSKHYYTEEHQRQKYKASDTPRGTTPDILFLDNCEVFVDGRPVKWIDAKHTLLMPDVTDSSILRRFMNQIRSYVDAYGPGAIFWSPSTVAPACIHETMDSCLDNASRYNVVHFSCNPRAV